ncbi:hypothetical protein LTR17_017877 [Elasticomyces elasticus]|nr:hypothetical protein LTR17_017877 [Elasticomyces elasticus]
MKNAFSSAVLVGAVAVSATPYGPLNKWGSGGGGSQPSASSEASSTASSWNSGSTAHPVGYGQTPFKFPLSNGFPDVDNATLRGIEETAQGTLPNGALPTAFQNPAGTTTIFELIAFNELFEVAFFSSLIYNITNNVEGFGIGSDVLKDYTLLALNAVLAQEELHNLGANGILAAAGQEIITPCEYVFPTAKFDDAIAFARTFTDVVLSTLQAGQAGLAAGGDDEFLTLLGAVQGQEGEQNGFYRDLLNLIPSAAPFLTLGAPQFAFSTLNQNVIVNGTCSGPGNDLLFKSIPIFGVLTITTDPSKIILADTNLSFSVETPSSASDVSAWSVAFLNQQNVPVISKVTNVKVNNGVATFDAWFPAGTNIMAALTISAVVQGDASKLTSVAEVAAATIFGPGLIEIN